MNTASFRMRRTIGKLWWYLHYAVEAPLSLVPKKRRDDWWYDQAVFPALIGASDLCVNQALRWWGRRAEGKPPTSGG